MRQRTTGLLVVGTSLVLTLAPLAQGAGIIRSIRMLAEDAASAAFRNGDLSSLIPTPVANALSQNSSAGLREALTSAPSLNHGVKAVATGGAGAAAARTTHAAGPPRGELSVFTEPAQARVRIMNIKPRYREGMSLAYGSYDVEVSAPGYRTKRFPLEVDSRQVGADVTLSPRTGFACEPDALALGGHFLQPYGLQARAELDLNDTTLYEAYSSLATKLGEESNYLHNVETRIGENYAYISAYQNSNLTKADVENNRTIEITDRAVKIHYGLEKTSPETVRFIAYAAFPYQVGTTDSMVRESLCLTLGEM